MTTMMLGVLLGLVSTANAQPPTCPDLIQIGHDCVADAHGVSGLVLADCDVISSAYSDPHESDACYIGCEVVFDLAGHGVETHGNVMEQRVADEVCPLL